MSNHSSNRGIHAESIGIPSDSDGSDPRFYDGVFYGGDSDDEIAQLLAQSNETHGEQQQQQQQQQQLHAISNNNKNDRPTHSRGQPSDPSVDILADNGEFLYSEHDRREFYTPALQLDDMDWDALLPDSGNDKRAEAQAMVPIAEGNHEDRSDKSGSVGTDGAETDTDSDGSSHASDFSRPRTPGLVMAPPNDSLYAIPSGYYNYSMYRESFDDEHEPHGGNGNTNDGDGDDHDDNLSRSSSISGSVPSASIKQKVCEIYDFLDDAMARSQKKPLLSLDEGSTVSDASTLKRGTIALIQELRAAGESFRKLGGSFRGANDEERIAGTRREAVSNESPGDDPEALLRPATPRAPPLAPKRSRSRSVRRGLALALCCVCLAIAAIAGLVVGVRRARSGDALESASEAALPGEGQPSLAPAFRATPFGVEREGERDNGDRDGQSPTAAMRPANAAAAAAATLPGNPPTTDPTSGPTPAVRWPSASASETTIDPTGNPNAQLGSGAGGQSETELAISDENENETGTEGKSQKNHATLEPTPAPSEDTEGNLPVSEETGIEEKSQKNHATPEPSATPTAVAKRAKQDRGTKRPKAIPAKQPKQPRPSSNEGDTDEGDDTDDDVPSRKPMTRSSAGASATQLSFGAASETNHHGNKNININNYYDYNDDYDYDYDDDDGARFVVSYRRVFPRGYGPWAWRTVDSERRSVWYRKREEGIRRIPVRTATPSAATAAAGTATTTTRWRRGGAPRGGW